MRRYAYFISCVVESTTKELDHSLELWQNELDIELVKLHEGTCCGASNLDYVNPDQFLLVNGRNIALAEKLGLDLVTSCNTCLLTLRRAKQELDASEEKRNMVNRFLEKDGLQYTGKSDVRHLLWILNEYVGLDTIRKKVKTPLKGVKIAPFYGCHILRPSNLFGGRDNPDSPKSLDQLVEALGGETVEYASNNKCCGFHTMIVAEEESFKVAGLAVKDGIDSGADYIVTPCPLCHLALDMWQKDAMDSMNDDRSIPILHLSQIVGLALGHSKEELRLNKHMVR